MAKYCLWLIIVLLCISPNVEAKTLALLGVFNESRLSFLFPKQVIPEMERINCTTLDKSIRPKLWRKKVPFGVGLNSTTNQAFFLSYNSFFKRKVIQIENSRFKKLADICTDSFGNIFIADSQQNKVFHFKLNKTFSAANFVRDFSIESPLKCEVDLKGNVVVINQDNQVKVIRKYKDRYILIQDLSKKISELLKDKKIIDLTINRQRDIFFLTSNAVFKCDRKGESIQEWRLEKVYISIENSFYGDIFLLNSVDKEIDKYTKDGFLLAKYSMAKDFKAIPKDFTVYDSYGQLAVTAGHEGGYYGMGVEIFGGEIKKLQKASGDRFYSIGFAITFPAKVTLRILDEKKSILKSYTFSKLRSGHHQVDWDGKNNKGDRVAITNINVKIEARAKYSTTNKDSLYLRQ